MARHLDEQALEKYQQSIIQIDPDFTDTNIENNPQTFFGLHNSFLLFDVMKAKADAFVRLFSKTQHKEHLKQGYSTYASALRLARHVERMYHSDESKLFLDQKSNPAYKEVIKTGLQLYELRRKTGIWLVLSILLKTAKPLYRGPTA